MLFNWQTSLIFSYPFKVKIELDRKVHGYSGKLQTLLRK